MNTILKRITTECFDNAERNPCFEFYKKVGKYEIYYNPIKNKICHHYCNHKIFEIDFKNKIKTQVVVFNSKIINKQLEYLKSFYEKFDFARITVG
jgi:hypothetical protein